MLSNSQEQKMIFDTKTSWKTEQEKNNPFLRAEVSSLPTALPHLIPLQWKKKAEHGLFSSFKTLIAKNQHDRNTIIILCKSHAQD